MSYIAVVDLGTGNLHSVGKALERVASGTRVEISCEPDVIGQASHVVLPGQGAVGTWLDALARQGLQETLSTVLQSRPVLGICLGLQALFDHSTEDGGRVGLGFLKGEVKHFTEGIGLDHDVQKVPHMGWNNVTQTTSHPLWAGINQHSRFYFVHSYYADVVQCVEVLGTTEYGVRFTSAAGRENVFAVQFHPEKSHTQGLVLLHNFVHWNGCT